MISEYVSDDLTKKALVVEQDGEFEVEFYNGGVLLQTRLMTGKTLRYAEDAAENYVMDVLKLGEE